MVGSLIALKARWDEFLSHYYSVVLFTHLALAIPPKGKVRSLESSSLAPVLKFFRGLFCFCPKNWI